MCICLIKINQYLFNRYWLCLNYQAIYNTDEYVKKIQEKIWRKLLNLCKFTINILKHKTEAQKQFWFFGIGNEESENKRTNREQSTWQSVCLKLKWYYFHRWLLNSSSLSLSINFILQNSFMFTAKLRYMFKKSHVPLSPHKHHLPYYYYTSQWYICYN